MGQNRKLCLNAHGCLPRTLHYYQLQPLNYCSCKLGVYLEYLDMGAHVAACPIESPWAQALDIVILIIVDKYFNHHSYSVYVNWSILEYLMGFLPQSQYH